MNNNTETRYCQNCGCELISINKKKLCDNCLRKTNSRKKGALKVMGSVLGLTVAVVTKNKFGGVKK